MKLFKDYPDTLEDAKNGKSLGFTDVLGLNSNNNDSIVDGEDVINSSNDGFDVELSNETFEEQDIEQPWE